MNDMSLIEDGLYMGAAITEKPAGIDAVMDLQIEHEDSLSPHKLQAFMWLPIADTPQAAPGPHWIELAVNTIIGWRSVGWNVLVHCKAGHSRSGMIVIAYIMKTRGMSVDAALAFVQSKRPVTHPNNGFVESLQRYAAFIS
jgi:protein-tyrosine phosphatase